MKGSAFRSGVILLLGLELWAQGWVRITSRLESATPIVVQQSTRTGRLWVSTEWILYTAPTVGAAWTAVTSLPFSTYTLALASQGATEALLAVTPYGLWRSTDEGANWAQTHPILSDRRVRLWVHPVYANVIAAMRGQMLWRSTDAGASWQPMTLPGGTLFAACPFGALDDVLAWSSDGLFRSTDGGVTWEAVPSTLPRQSVQSLAVTGGIEPRLFVLIGDTVYHSSDGISWTATAAPTPPRALFAFGSSVVAVAPGALLLFRPNNTWETIYTGFTDHITAVLPVGPDRLLVGSELRGIELYRWLPQPQWQPLRTGMDAPPITRMLRSEYSFLLGGPSGIFWSDTDIAGLDNISLSLPKPATITAMTLLQDGLLVSTRIGIYRYRRSSGQWSTVAEVLPAVGTIVALAASPSGDTILALSEFGELLRSTDGGATWETPSFAYQVSFLERHGDTFYAFGTDGILYSHDGGSSWSPLTSYPGGSCYLLSFHPATPQILACSALPNSRTGALYRSTDGGSSWQTLEADELLGRGLTTLIAGTASQTWYAGTLEGEIFRSSDNGSTWHSLGIVGDGLPIQALLELGSLLIAGTWRGAWYQLIVGISESYSPSVILRIANGELQLRLPEPTTVRLQIYNLLGRCLGYWTTSSPTSSLILPLPALASGTYMLRLQAGNKEYHTVLPLP